MTTELRRNYCTNPQPNVFTGYSGPGAALAAAPWNAARQAYKTVATGAGVAYTFSQNSTAGVLKTGNTVTVSAMVQVPAGKYYRAYVHELEGNRYYNDAISLAFILSDGASVRVYRTTLLTDNATNKHDVGFAIIYTDDTVGSGANATAGTTVYVGDVLVEKTNVQQPFFDGSFGPQGDGKTVYAWTGAPNASESVITMADVPVSKYDTTYASLLGTYGPGSLVDMEYKRLLSVNGLVAPQKLSLYDLYARAGQRPRIY